MATATLVAPREEEADELNPQEEFQVGVLAGLEWSPVDNAELSDQEKSELDQLRKRAAKRDYPARLMEVIQAWESALFYRGFQFLVPQKGGGWIIPGESTGYGPSVQMDLALLPTNIYSSYGQILISALTRSVPPVRFEPQDANNNAQVTAAESAEKFVKVIERNNDLVMIQTDAARYLYTDGRALYWTRFEKDGQRFGWEEDDQPDDLIPENEPPEQMADAMRAAEIQKEEPGEEMPTELPGQEIGSTIVEPEGEGEETVPQLAPRRPRGQEVRTAHGKLEMKLVPMTANCLAECHVVQFEHEVDESTAKGKFPWVADEIRAGQQGISEGEIARLARLNVKLGMQSTYITSDSIADDVTVQRTWMRRSYFMKVTDKGVRQSLMEKFPDGCLLVYCGDTFCYARNESMDDSLALMQAFSGDGQNRNALGTSMMPIQKRVNNWLDLMNDFFVRTVPKKYVDNKAFNVEALRAQTNVPGDIAPFKSQGRPVSELIFVEPMVNPPASLADFVKQYIGPLSELLTGAYPALSGGDTGSNDTAHGIAIQRDQALGRLGPTWHSITNAEAVAMKQAVRWGAKCRDKSINERIPGGETISLEVNNLRANILCFAESDENFPEGYTQKQNRLMQFMSESGKNPMLQEVLYNPSNLEFLQSMVALNDLYIPQVASYDKQNGEIEMLLKGQPVPNPDLVKAEQQLQLVSQTPNINPQMLIQAQMQIQQLKNTKPFVSSMPIDAQTEDNETEAFACWKYLNSPEGRKAKRTNAGGYANVRLHFLEHTEALQQKQGASGGGKPPNKSMALKDMVGNERAQLLAQGGIQADQIAEKMEQVNEIAAANKPPEAAAAPAQQ